MSTPKTAGFNWTMLLLRLVVGAAFVLHGLPKIQNATGWMGPMLPAPLQVLAAVAEFGGGLALIFGLFTSLASAGLIITMLSALALVHLPHNHPFVSMGGESSELAWVYLAISAHILASGPGAIALDSLFFKTSTTATHAACGHNHDHGHHHHEPVSVKLEHFSA